MTSSAVIDLALGLMFVYLVVSVAVSRINEFVTSRTQLRAQGLERGLRAMLGGTPESTKNTAGVQSDGKQVPAPDTTSAAANLVQSPALSAEAIKNHPAIAAMDAGLAKGRRISYLSARAFGLSVLDILAPPAISLLDTIDTATLTEEGRNALTEFQNHPDATRLDAFANELGSNYDVLVAKLRSAISDDPLEQARKSVALMSNNPARSTLLRMIEDAEDDRAKFRTALEHWFDDEMDRVAGWYKRNVQKWIIVYSAALTLFFNVDTIGIAESLWSSPVEQAAASAAAVAATEKTPNDVITSLSVLQELSLPIGWTPPHVGTAVSTDPRHFPADSSEILLKVLGLAITIFALSFGAPFWFDALGKLARVRNAGNTPATATSNP